MPTIETVAPFFTVRNKTPETSAKWTQCFRIVSFGVIAALILRFH
jgi:hypothetical protein